jgi:hypothetical protein
VRNVEFSAAFVAGLPVGSFRGAGRSCRCVLVGALLPFCGVPGDLGAFRLLGLRVGLCAVSGIPRTRLGLGAAWEIHHPQIRPGRAVGGVSYFKIRDGFCARNLVLSVVPVHVLLHICWRSFSGVHFPLCGL